MGTLTLERFNGVEKYSLDHCAAFAALKEDMSGRRRVVMWFQTGTKPEPLLTLPDTEPLGISPKAEIAIEMDELNLSTFGTQRFEVERGYDQMQDRWNAEFLYAEKQEVNHNVVRIEYLGDGILHLFWTGRTTDLSYYDGSKPDTIIEVEGRFYFEDYKQWETGNHGPPMA